MKYLIVANSPIFTKKIIEELAPNKVVIALDGVVHQLIKYKINFDVMLGDFDSVNFKTIKISSNTKIIETKNQNQTDLEKAIDYCDENKATQIDIVCATSGRMDHTLRNTGMLRMKYKVNRPIYLHTELQTLEFARDKTVTMTGEIGDYCGILAFPSASFTSKGLVYNGDNYELIFGIQESTSNQLKTPTAKIQIQGEALIIHPGNLKSQRKLTKNPL